MSDLDIKLTRLQLLKLEYNKLKEDRDEFSKDLIYTKRTLNRTENITLVEDFINPRKSSSKVLMLPSSNQTKKSNIQSRLALYELTNDIRVEHITMDYYPIQDKDNNVQDTSWFKFEVDAYIDRIKFHITYVSNQDIETCYNNETTNYDIKELNIQMKKQIHQVELEAGLLFFSKNPSKIALAINCLSNYNKLYQERLNIKKILIQENPELVKCNMIIEEENLAYLEIIASSKSTSRLYFEIKWRIIWDKKICSVTDFFQISVPFEDQTFVDSISHNFNKLCSTYVAEVNLFQDVEKNKTNNSKPNIQSEEVKLNLLRNAMIAVKAAEHIE